MTVLSWRVPHTSLILLILHAKNQPYILNIELVIPFLVKSRNPWLGKYPILKFLNIDIFEEFEGFQVINEFTKDLEISSLVM